MLIEKVFFIFIMSDGSICFYGIKHSSNDSFCIIFLHLIISENKLIPFWEPFSGFWNNELIHSEKQQFSYHIRRFLNEYITLPYNCKRLIKKPERIKKRKNRENLISGK